MEKPHTLQNPSSKKNQLPLLQTKDNNTSFGKFGVGRTSRAKRVRGLQVQKRFREWSTWQAGLDSEDWNPLSPCPHLVSTKMRPGGDITDLSCCYRGSPAKGSQASASYRYAKHHWEQNQYPNVTSAAYSCRWARRMPDFPQDYKEPVRPWKAHTTK